MKRGFRMSEKCLAVVEIDQDLCSRCYVCQSICPYDAIKRDSTGKWKLTAKNAKFAAYATVLVHVQP